MRKSETKTRVIRKFIPKQDWKKNNTFCLILLVSLIIILIGFFLIFDNKNKSSLKSELQKASSQTATKIKENGVKNVDEFRILPPEKIKYNTIFVSVASYRDDECKETVWQMFEKAENPDNIFVGVVQQNKKKKEDCFNKCKDCKKRIDSGNIKVLNFDFTEAQGPCFARYQATKLYTNEEYYMQIDSHTKFEKNWDKILFNQIRKTEDPFAILASYPPTEEQMKDLKKKNHVSMIAMCESNFKADKLPGIKAKIIKTPKDKKPLLIPYISAGMVVMPAQALYDVPFDPYLSFLFFGEEILHSARLWTSGYNFYAPVIPFVIHHYGRKGKPKFWSDNKKYGNCRKKAITRVKKILNYEKIKVDPEYSKSLEKYGLGKKRSLKAYFEFAKIDIENKKAVGKFC